VVLCTELVRVSRSELKPSSCGTWESWTGGEAGVKIATPGVQCTLVDVEKTVSCSKLEVVGWTMLAVGVSDTGASCYLLAAVWSGGPLQGSATGNGVLLGSLEPCPPTCLGSCIHCGK
jgi:hypothetical protein